MARQLDEKNQRSPHTSAYFALEGDLDAEGGSNTARLLRDAILAGRSDLTVNLDGVGVLDSAGLASLITTLRLARDHGGDVRIEASEPRIRRILEITALSRVFKMRPSRQAA
ncbi:MAG TPA: STAS domain-containing protein [Candidatus Eremiobacteraceae bacterium]|nr:STAS domain-containing protein [Candidatus Eremiobacteraceae bacterium]